MSASGYTPILIYASGTATNVPLAANMTSSASGAELALNYADGKLFYKDSSGVVQVLASKAGNVNVASFQTSLGGLTPSTATTGVVTLAGTLNTSSGGTGLTSYTAGDLPYYAAGTLLSKLAIGTSGQILTSSGTAPQWSTLSGVAVTSFSAGTTGFTPSSATAGAVTLGGTLLEANGGTGTTTGYNNFKNRIINGAMVIDQRNAGASQSYGSTGSTYCLDRFFLGNSQTGKVTSQQNAGSVTPPAGFQNYLGVTVAAAITPSASDTFYLSQAIEGCNLLDLNWGTANAQSITISAWVRSSATGTFGGSVINSGAISPRRTYCFTYNIPVANTWTYITVTIPGDTTGTWYQIGNGVGMYVVFSYGVGSTNSTTSGSFQNGNQISATGAVSIMGTLGATFYITGVQLEKGSTATSFDYRPYGTELVLCQRYFVKTYGQSVAVPTNSSGGFVRTRSYSGSYGAFVWLLPVTMRTAPTATIYNQSTSAVNSWWNVDASTSATADVSTTGEQSITVESSGLSTNNTYEFQLTGSAEL